MTLHPTVGSAAHNLSTVNHPQAFNQHTTVKKSFVSQHFYLKRMDKGMDESHPPYRPLNRPKNRKGFACIHSMCQHANFLSLYFKFYLI